jgi:hypothetical protein
MALTLSKIRKYVRDKFKMAVYHLGFDIVMPPHVIKQWAIADYQRSSGIRLLVETGTYMGDMLATQRSNFDLLFSIELSPELFQKATRRFTGDPKIKLFQGDSSTMLEEIVTGLNDRAIFWLDGHYSGGVTAKGIKNCPVNEELEVILKSPHRHIVLIDDARLFNGTDDYPTVQAMESKFKTAGKDIAISVRNDIIRILYV